MSRWLDKEYDPDDYNHMPNPKIPLKYGEWEELAAKCRGYGDGPPATEMVQLYKAVGSLLSYTHKMQWKVDYLLDYINNASSSKPGPADFATLVVKHPFLAACDDHVAKLSNVAPMMLSRTPQVRPLSLLHALYLMIFTTLL